MVIKKPRESRRRITESGAVRLFSYVMFGVSSLALMASLSVPGTNWRPWLVGTLIYGVLSVFMYRSEERRKDHLAERVAAAGARRSSLDFQDDDDDPTTPPEDFR